MKIPKFSVPVGVWAAPIDSKYFEVLVEIAKTLKVEVAHNDPENCEIVGDPPIPGSTVVVYKEDKSLVLVTRKLLNASDYETALHELAHIKLGLDDKTLQDENIELKCYEIAAIWALKFPVEVAAQVHRIYTEINNYE